MKYPTMRVVFDRKKTATKEKNGLVQIEILHEGKRKYISSGVKVYAGQWKAKTMVTGRMDSLELNERINSILSNIREFINELIKRREEFTFDKLEHFLEVSSKGDSFLNFMYERIETRTIAASTKKQHMVVLHKLEEFGLIQYFSDVTVKNIKLFDDFIRKTTNNQSTVHGVHKRLKVYVKEAAMLKLIDENPYDSFVVQRGKPGNRKYLSVDEIEAIKNAEITDNSISNVRDCFLFCCYTGLAYSDISKFKWEDVEKYKGNYIIRDARKKTDVPYNITILSPALAILKKHNYVMPVISNQQYNMRLKVLASYANIKKNLTSHVARHTFATWALSQGVRVEIVSKMLGHTDIATTQIYAKVLQDDVTEGFNLLESKIKS